MCTNPPHKQPPSSTTTEQPSQPPTPANEPIGPEIIQAIKQAVASTNRREHEKALNFIKDSISCHPLSGQLQYTEGWIHWRLANNAGTEDDDVAKVKHLEDGVRSAQLAVELLPNSLHCAHLLVDLLYDLAFFNKEWERVDEACDHGLGIETPIDFGVRDLFGDDPFDQVRLEEDLQCLDEVQSLASLELAVKKTVDVDINHLVMRKKQTMKKLKDNSNDILKYMTFWNVRLSDEKKRGFRKVNIEELGRHLKLLKDDQVAVDLLCEAIDFAKKHRTWRFWECCGCLNKFVDYGLFRKHFWEVHWMGCRRFWTLKEEFIRESVDIIVNGMWKPIELDEATKDLFNPVKSEKGLDECKSSSTEEVPRKISRTDGNESLERSTDGPKWEFCDDVDRSEILGRIRDLMNLLHKNRCLAPIHVRWAIEYTENQFECIIPLSQYLKLGLKALQIVWFLGASQLTEVLKFFKDMVSTCGLSENVEMNSLMDDKHSDEFDIKERVIFSRDLSCLLLDERVLRGMLNATNYFEPEAGDGSAASFSDEAEDDVLFDSDNIVSWLYMGFSCGEVLESWIRLRESRIRQAKKFQSAFLETISVLPKLCARYEENPGKLVAVQRVEYMIREENKKRGTSPEYQPQSYIDLLKKRQEELQEKNDNSFVKQEIDVISEILQETQEVLSDDQVPMRRKEICIAKEQRRLKIQLLKDASFHDAVVLRKVSSFNGYEEELTNISVFDYRAIVVPVLKSLVQSHLKDMYEDDNEKCEAAVEALLAEEALQDEKKTKKDSGNVVMQNQDKKKKKKKKKKK